MHSRIAKRLGVPVSEIGLGCWQLGSVDWGQISDHDSLAILQNAVNHGVTFIDTADVYGSGRSETLIGKFRQSLPEHERKKLFIATKLGRLKGFPNHYSYDLLRQCALDSIQRLGVESLDLQQLHCVPPQVLSDGHVFEWLRRLKKEGLVKHFGASVESMDEAHICLQHDDCDALQIIFNIFRQKPIAELFETAKAKGVALIVRLPLASGLLAGTYTAQTRFPEKDHRNYNRDGAAFNVGETFAGIPFEKAVELAGQLKSFVPAGTKMADWSMRWILDHDAVTTVIPGASKPAQAAANVAASALPPLPPALHARLRHFYETQVQSHIRGPY